ncbi:hypothetical protein BC834DRAFT_120557 [Gloeopeniophorella convolvens]|nr:hypothetical protein BC834DRAFT_120557 [Gloeopeniophorella convolvens]
MNSHTQQMPVPAFRSHRHTRPTTHWHDIVDTILPSALEPDTREGDRIPIVSVTPPRAITDPASSFSSPPPSPDHVSVSHRAIANELHSDILLIIFDWCRSLDPQAWYCYHRWLQLTHVSRSWRWCILTSPIRMRLILCYRRSAPKMDSLRNLPPLPVSLDYSEPQDGPRWATENRSRHPVLGLEELADRLLAIEVDGPSAILGDFARRMGTPVPSLCYLSLSSASPIDNHITLSDEFLGGTAPRLHYLRLAGVSLPANSRLLQSCSSLTSLSLLRIPSEVSYISPSELAMSLRTFTHLKELALSFLSTPPPTDPKDEMSLLQEQVVLPELETIVYHGDVAYLDALLSGLAIPAVRRADIRLFYRPTLSVKWLPTVVAGIPGRDIHAARVTLKQDSVEFCAHSMRSSDSSATASMLSIVVSIRPHDWQVHSINQVCGALNPTLSFTETLVLDSDPLVLSPQLSSGIESSLWRTLLSPFVGVTNLHISSELASELELRRALQGGQDMLLPVLTSVGLIDQEDATASANDFRFGYPI